MVAAIVAFLLVSIAAGGLAKAFSQFFRGSSRLDHGARGDQVLVRTAARIQEMDFDSLLALCRDRNALPGPAEGHCRAGDRLNPDLGFNAATVTDGTLEVPRDWEGKPTLGGQVCVELNQCTPRGGGLMLQLKLQGFWIDPKLGLQSRLFAIRRTRW